MAWNSMVIEAPEKIEALLANQREISPFVWRIAKPMAATHLTVSNALRGAYLVLTGRAVAILWY